MTDTVTGAPVAGSTRTVSGTRATVSAPGYVTRELAASATQIDLIPLAGFDLSFYRQLVRGAMDGELYPTQTWTVNPSFYMEAEGVKGLPRQVTIDLERVARRLVPLLTGGRLQVARWETGPEPRPERIGWIVIERRDEPGVCGRAGVGWTAGHIWLDANHQGCSYAAVFAHELGHALGFFHVSTQGSMMYPQQRNSNMADAPAEKERAHMTIAYKRPVGSRDIDQDPALSSLAPARIIID